MRILPALLTTALLSACAAPGLAPGNGWSRASDLSVYSGMATVATVARDETSLCYGYSPATVEAQWYRDFGERESAVTAALVSRYGVEAVEAAQAEGAPVRRVPCPDVEDGYWQQQYAQLLRLLEMRLGLA